MEFHTPPGQGAAAQKAPAEYPWKRIGKRKQKVEGYHDQAMLDACRGEPCYLSIPGVCVGGTETTVPAHSNQARHGKGMGIKAKDEYSVPACYACHTEIDQGSAFTREEKFALWNKAYAAWKPVREEKLNAKPAAYGRKEKAALAGGLI